MERKTFKHGSRQLFCIRNISTKTTSNDVSLMWLMGEEVTPITFNDGQKLMWSDFKANPQDYEIEETTLRELVLAINLSCHKFQDIWKDNLKRFITDCILKQEGGIADESELNKHAEIIRVCHQFEKMCVELLKKVDAGRSISRPTVTSILRECV